MGKGLSAIKSFARLFTGTVKELKIFFCSAPSQPLTIILTHGPFLFAGGAFRVLDWNLRCLHEGHLIIRGRAPHRLTIIFPRGR
ncbi:MAG: hypothetical protein RDV48_11160 [Candidatus Eremiobacteraeota bacterium]|nr:hypothetical protein [Candidatus Eremiobacteraeota bacterium]